MRKHGELAGEVLGLILARWAEDTRCRVAGVDSRVLTASHVEPLDRDRVAQSGGKIHEIDLVCDRAGKIVRVCIDKDDAVGCPRVPRVQCNSTLDKGYGRRSRRVPIEDSDEKCADSYPDNCNSVLPMTMRHRLCLC